MEGEEDVGGPKEELAHDHETPRSVVSEAAGREGGHESRRASSAPQVGATPPSVLGAEAHPVAAHVGARLRYGGTRMG